MIGNYFMSDDLDIYLYSWFGFDYAFCDSNCSNSKCGRNYKSKSYKTMIKTEPTYTASDFSSECKKYKKPKKVTE